MNKDILAGQWKQARGIVKQRWGELTDSELDRVEGNQEELAGILQEKYGYTKEKALAEVNDFLEDLKWKLR
jgi:uncharacterized protein YjbJ (UPF0337 family)